MRNCTVSPAPPSPIASDLAHSPIHPGSRAMRSNRKDTGSIFLPEVPAKVSSSLDSVDSMHSPYFLHAADHPGLMLLSHIFKREADLFSFHQLFKFMDFISAL